MIDNAADNESHSARQRARQHSYESHQKNQRNVLQSVEHQGDVLTVTPDRTGGKMELKGKEALLQQKAVAAATALIQSPASAAYCRCLPGPRKLTERGLPLVLQPESSLVQWIAWLTQKARQPQPGRQRARLRALLKRWVRQA